MTVYHSWKAGDADDAPAYCGVVKPDMTPDGGTPEFCPKCMEVLHAQTAEDMGNSEVHASPRVLDLTEGDDDGVPAEVKAIAKALLGQLGKKP